MTTTGTLTAPATGPAPDPTGSGRLVLLAAELGALALGLGTVAAFGRLFQGSSFLVGIGLPVTLSWAVAVLCRRARLHIGVSLAVSAVAGMLVLSWMFAPGTTAVGLPTPTTVRTLAGAVGDSFGGFERLVAPVPATDGFLVVLAALLWVFAFFADTSAFRYRSTVQAVIPYSAAFVASGVLARDSGRLAAAVWFGAGVVAYAITQRVLDMSRRRWLRGDGARGPAAVAGTAALVAVVALAVGAVAGPLLPGDEEPVVDLRELGQGDGPRTVVSPFVGVTSLLGERSDVIAFSVEAGEQAYWRLTALERYDAARGIWVSRGTYRTTDGADLSEPTTAPTAPLVQRYRIEGLGGLWLPMAFAPERVAGDTPVSVDPGSDSVIVREGTVESGTTYAVRSLRPTPTPEQLATAGPGRDQVAPEDLSTDGVTDELARTARRVVREAGATTAYAQALALQEWFRGEFTYDEDVDYRDASDPVAAFLAERRGFCQQFSSTYALMARSLGLPARVAVGFTPGDPVELGSADTGPRPGFVVRGRHAHAWPEVHLGGIGWLAFEPTPGRGNPQAEQYTGVAPAQAGAPEDQAATTTSVAPPTGAPGAATTLPPTGGLDALAPEEPARVGGGPGGAPVWAWAVPLAVLAGLLVGTRAARRRSRRRQLLRDPNAGRVAVVWDDAVQWAALAGIRVRPTETPAEFAERAAAEVPAEGWPVLAEAETRRRYADEPPDAELVRAAEAALDEVREAVRARVPARKRAVDAVLR